MPKKPLTPRQVMAGNIILCILTFVGFTYMAYILEHDVSFSL